MALVDEIEQVFAKLENGKTQSNHSYSLTTKPNTSENPIRDAYNRFGGQLPEKLGSIYMRCINEFDRELKSIDDADSPENKITKIKEAVMHLTGLREEVDRADGIDILSSKELSKSLGEGIAYMLTLKKQIC